MEEQYNHLRKSDRESLECTTLGILQTLAAVERIEHMTTRWEFYMPSVLQWRRGGAIEHALQCLPLVNLWSKPPQPWLCQSGYILGQTQKIKQINKDKKV